MNDMIEKIIREEVRSILSQKEDNKQSPSSLEPVPMKDMPNTILQEYGLSNRNIDSNATLDEVLQGQSVEPNEALEGSVLDPLSNSLLTAGVRGALSVPQKYASMVQKNAVNYNLEMAEKLNKIPKVKSYFADDANMKRRTILEPQFKTPGSSTAAAAAAKEAGNALGGSLGGVFEKVGDFINFATDPALAPFSKAAAQRTYEKIGPLINKMDTVPQSLKSKVEPKRRTPTEMLLFSPKTISGKTDDAVSRILGPDNYKLKRYGTGSAINTLLNTDKDVSDTGYRSNEPASFDKMYEIDSSVKSKLGSITDKIEPTVGSIIDYLKMTPEEKSKISKANNEMNQQIINRIKDIAKGEGILLEAPNDIIEYLNKYYGTGGREPVRAIEEDYKRQNK